MVVLTTDAARTRDLGGTVTTSEVAAVVIDALQRARPAAGAALSA